MAEIRSRKEAWRASLKPTKEQLLQTTHETNRMLVRMREDTPQFWEGLDREWRDLQKPDSPQWPGYTPTDSAEPPIAEAEPLKPEPRAETEPPLDQPTKPKRGMELSELNKLFEGEEATERGKPPSLKDTLKSIADTLPKTESPLEVAQRIAESLSTPVSKQDPMEDFLAKQREREEEWNRRLQSERVELFNLGDWAAESDRPEPVRDPDTEEGIGMAQPTQAPEVSETIGSWRRRFESTKSFFKHLNGILRVLALGLAIGSLTWSWQVLGADEYGVALGLVVLFAVFSLVSLYGWAGIHEYPKATKTIKTFLIIGVGVIAVYSAAVIWQKKGQKPLTTLWGKTTPPVQTPSFVFIKPGLWLSNKTWTFQIEKKGSDPVYNIEIIFTDKDRQRAAVASGEMSEPIDTVIRHPEVDSNLGAAKYWLWTPLQPEHEHFTAFISYRGGHLEQNLRIEKIGKNWAYATRVAEVETKRILIECRDPAFPPDQEWDAGLPKCFPDFPLKN